MKNLAIGVKLFIGFGVVLLVTVALGVVSSQTMRNMDIDSTNIETAYMPMVSMSSDVEAHVASSALRVKDFFIAGRDADLEEAYAELTKADELLKKQVTLAQSRKSFEALETHLKNIQTTQQQYVVELDNSVVLYRQLNKLRTEVAVMADQSSALAIGFQDFQGKRFNIAIDSGSNFDLPDIAGKMDYIDTIVVGINQISITFLRAYAADSVEDSKLIIPLIDKEKESIRKLLAIVTHDVQKANIEQLEKSVNALGETLVEYINVWERYNDAVAMRVPTSSALTTLAQSSSSLGIALTTTTATKLSRDTASGATRALSLTAVAALFAIIIAFILTRAITRPVGLCLRFAEDVASGKLDSVLVVNQNDEIGRLGKSLQTMLKALILKINEADENTTKAEVKSEEARVAMLEAEAAKKMAESAKRDGMLAAASQLESVVEVISSASTELAAQIEHSESGAEKSASRLIETATAMEEMNSTVIEIARNSGHASEITNLTKHKAEEGAVIVQKAVASIQKVQNESLELKKSMINLGTQAQAINQIMSVISEIADQTNLLALNAAIEAARAGDAGRGFAVVADEVRKLAEKTMISTNDVGNAIKSIQESARKSSDQVDSAVKTIEEATILSNNSGVALEEIVNMIENAADQVRAIATAAEEQSATSEEINHSVNEVNSIVSGTAAAMGQASVAVNDLAAQSQKLNLLIQDMQKD